MQPHESPFRQTRNLPKSAAAKARRAALIIKSVHPSPFSELGRAFDDCFEMGDGGRVFEELCQMAAKDADLLARCRQLGLDNFAARADEIANSFTLKNDPPKHQPARFQSQERTLQKVCVDGMDCLPGQLDLF